MGEASDGVAGQVELAAAVAAGARHGAHVTRAVAPATDHPLLADLRLLGLTAVDAICYYQAPTSSARQ
ncbi:hypothetical protein [Microtetraspora niveoalba]|uniref:hypothetical protein n=1 Tax=Microtetraspora niveoalba TaxID=46175 RepID=UPI001470CDC6|nr:hypothetical protein [Microtetraspora niveoalba]